MRRETATSPDRMNSSSDDGGGGGLGGLFLRRKSSENSNGGVAPVVGSGNPRPRRRSLVSEIDDTPALPPPAAATAIPATTRLLQRGIHLHNSLPNNIDDGCYDWGNSDDVSKNNYSTAVSNNTATATTTAAASTASSTTTRNALFKNSFNIVPMGKQRRSTTGEVEEKTSTGTNGTTGAAGLRIPFRRFSLSDVLHRGTHNAHLKGHDSSVSTYQEVFQQMKLQYPQSSFGALQQMTMQRIAEMKKLEEEQHEKEMEKLRRDYNNNSNSNSGGGGKLTLFKSLRMRPSTDDSSDKIIVGGDNSDNWNESSSDRNGSSDRSDRDNNNIKNNANINNDSNFRKKAPFMIDDSYRSKSSIELPLELTSPRTTVPILSRISSLTSGKHQDGSSTMDHHYHQNRRRSNVESNPLSEADTSDGGGGVIPIMHAQLLQHQIREDQKGNFAPRRSVGDLTAMANDMEQLIDGGGDDADNSIATGSRVGNQSSGCSVGAQSLCSEMSGLFISGGESDIIQNNNTNNRARSSSGSGGSLIDDSSRASEQQLQLYQMQLQQQVMLDISARSSCDDSSKEAYLSVLSSDHYSEDSCTAATGGTLIVGFGGLRKRNSNDSMSPRLTPRRSLSQQLREEEDKSRGFAADFSAWDNR